MSRDSTALLVIDVQLGMFESPIIAPVSGGPELLHTLSGLIVKAREAGIPVIYVQHLGGKDSPIREGTPQGQIHPAIAPQPGERVVQKRFSDSFQQSNLHEVLQQRGISHLVIVGIQSEFCVDTACRRAFSLGYEVVLVADAHSTWDNQTLKAGQIVCHHNETLSGGFVKLAKADSLFQPSSARTATS